MTCPHKPRWPNGHMVESLSLSSLTPLEAHEALFSHGDPTRCLLRQFEILESVLLGFESNSNFKVP